MGELIFRAWHKEEERYYEVGSVIFYTKKICIGLPYDNKWVSFDEIIIEQYTGMKDKEGNEIYEGDIVTFVGMIYKVYFCSKHMQFRLGNRNTSIGMNFSQNLSYLLVGNIHENSDLLND